MLVYEHPSFDSECPECFNWNKQTGVKIESAARIICEEIRANFATRERTLVPGLRAALIALAKVAEFYEGG